MTKKSIHGGSLVRGKRKNMRPLSRKCPHHFVLKSKRRDLYTYKDLFESELRRYAEKFHLRIYDIAVNHTHMHFTLYVSEEGNYPAFIRSFTGLMARKLGKNLWNLLPFSRSLQWGQDYQKVKHYLEKNRREAEEKHTFELINAQLH